MTKYIALEGIDGTGKGVQTQLLVNALRERHLRVGVLSFPDYESFFGGEVGKYLSGREGVKANEVDQKSMALWFAMDRREALRRFDTSALDAVIFNRYVLSNAVYQSIRKIDAGRPPLLPFVEKLEYEILGLPRPDRQLILDVAPATAAGNVEKKGFREYVGNEKDVYEAEDSLQDRAREMYLRYAARIPGAVVVPCMENGALLPIPAVHALVLKEVLPLFGF